MTGPRPDAYTGIRVAVCVIRVVVRPRSSPNTMTIVLTLVHVIVCLFLIIVVLLQSGKAADLAGAFGGMGSQTAFGPRGSATLLSKATTIAATLFMVTSLVLAIMATKNSGVGSTILERQSAPATRTAPSRPAPPPSLPMPRGGTVPAPPAKK